MIGRGEDDMWRRCLPLLASMLFLCSCTKLALRATPDLVPNLSGAVFEECDPVLAERAMPADLKLMEGLLRIDPENRRLLTALCMGFTGYALLFVEDDDPQRASPLFLRAKGYGLRALGEGGRTLGRGHPRMEEVIEALSKVGEKDLPALFWTVMAWNAWINLNLDKPAALSELGIAEKGVERILEVDPSYLYGSPYVLMGVMLAAKPKMMGGDVLKSKVFFEKALEVGRGEFFLAKYYFARYWAVRAQDKVLFLRLLEETADGDPGRLKEVCLVNAVMKQKAKRLMEKTEEFFY